MRLRITIIGPIVHDVGYRLFLMNSAIAGRIRMFEAYNIEGEKEQQLVIYVDGSEFEVEAFRRFAETKRPAKAVVSKIAAENFDGEVMRVGEFAQIYAAVQLGEAKLILGDMKDDIKFIKEDAKELKWGVRDVGGEVKEMNANVKNFTGM